MNSFAKNLPFPLEFFFCLSSESVRSENLGAFVSRLNWIFNEASWWLLTEWHFDWKTLVQLANRLLTVKMLYSNWYTTRAKNTNCDEYLGPEPIKNKRSIVTLLQDQQIRVAQKIGWVYRSHATPFFWAKTFKAFENLSCDNPSSSNKHW